MSYVTKTGEGNGNPLQYSCLENPVDRGAWWAAVHRVAQSRTRLKRLSMHACIGEGHGNPLQYSCLDIPGIEKTGGLPSMGSHRVGHDWSDLAAAAVSKTKQGKQTNKHFFHLGGTRLLINLRSDSLNIHAHISIFFYLLCQFWQSDNIHSILPFICTGPDTEKPTLYKICSNK